MWVAIIVVSCIYLLGFIRFGVRAKRSRDGQTKVIVRAGIFRFDLTKRLQKSKKPKPEKIKKDKEPSGFKDPKTLLRMVKPVMRSLRKGLRIDRMNLKLILGGSEDPYSAAMMYGRLNMAWGVLRPLINQTFRVKKQNVEIGLNFEQDRTQWEGELYLTMSLGRSFAVLFAALGAMMRNPSSQKKSRKAV
ncbi:MAG: DUF2953 domain-containing protein [Oscillospiraceae bacterium]|nr:DUF2953 domain-containing protein [Oscillospiraceae bacterium]